MQTRSVLRSRILHILLTMGISILTSFIAFVIFISIYGRTIDDTYNLVKEIHEAVIKKNTVYDE